MNEELVEIISAFSTSKEHLKLKICMQYILMLEDSTGCEGVNCETCYVHSHFGYAGQVIKVGVILYEPRTS